jgi:oligoendopeptidase F
MMDKLVVTERSRANPENTWNAESVFSSIREWEAEYEKIEMSIPSLSSLQDALHKGAAELVQVLKEVEDILCRTSKLMVYASMSYSVDTTNQAAAAMYDRMHNLAGKVQGAAAFLGPELISLGQEKLNRWMKDEPQLNVYAHYLENLFRQQRHVRSAEIEEILGMLTSPFSGAHSTYSALTDADLKFQAAKATDGREIPVTQSTIDAILHDTDREVRRTSWENYMDGYLANKNTLANTLATSVKQDVFDMQIRKHTNTLQASLFDNNIPVEVFHNLIKVFKNNLPTWHRYWRLRRKVLGVKTLYPYDIWAPLTNAQPEIEYKQAVDFISAGLAPLGDEYVKALQQGCLADRWVDSCVNLGKMAGAFSSGSYGTFPFICMSFNNDVNSLSTLAHELGHSMHSYLTGQQQPYIYSEYSLFVAEVASNFHQAMVRAHLLKTKTDASFQVALLEEAMSNFHRYFFIMPTLARFELEIHQRAERGDALTADTMNRLMTELFTEGYGGEFDVDQERTGITWATFTHLFYDYYVYQYATGISAAHALVNRVLTGVPKAAQDYRSFLSAGGSLYPLEALKLAGVDLSTPQAVEETFLVLAGYIDRLERLLLR